MGTGEVGNAQGRAQREGFCESAGVPRKRRVEKIGIVAPSCFAGTAGRYSRYCCTLYRIILMAQQAKIKCGASTSSVFWKGSSRGRTVAA